MKYVHITAGIYTRAKAFIFTLPLELSSIYFPFDPLPTGNNA